MLFAGLSACIAVIATLSIVLTFLVIVKCIFIQCRRTYFTRSRSQGSRYLYSYQDSSATSPLSGVAKKYAFGDYAHGFCVGFFGSPGFESTVVSKLTEKQLEQESFFSQVHPEIRRPEASQSRSPNTTRASSISFSAAEYRLSMQDHNDTLTQSRSRSLPLPISSVKAQPRSKRRLSLPSISSSILKELAPQKRHSSLKSTNGMKQQIQQTSSVRLVNGDTLLPLSFVSPATSYRATFRSRLVQKPAARSPLPLSSLHDQQPGLRISHPFALLPLAEIRQMSQDDFPTPRPLSLCDNPTPPSRSLSSVSPAMKLPLRPFPVVCTPPKRSSISPDLVDFPVPEPLPLAEDTAGAQRKMAYDTAPRAPLSNVPNSILHTSSPHVAKNIAVYPTPGLSPPLSIDSMGPMAAAPPSLSKQHQPPYAKRLILTDMARRRSWARKSVPLGPSPLRTMILPDSLSASSSSSASVENERKEGTLFSAAITSLSKNRGYGTSNRVRESLSVVFEEEPSIFETCEPAAVVSDVSTDEGSADGAGDTLLCMIRDLVRASTEWDGSVVLEEGFKAMVSEATGSCPDGARPSSWNEQTKAALKEGGTAICDVDMDLLGLDRIRRLTADDLGVSGHNEMIFRGAQEECNGEEVTLFWEEGKEDGWRESVGVAW